MDCFAYCKINKCVITIFDSFAYYKLRQRVITIYDSAVITILDNCYYNLQQVLQFTTLLQLTRENMMLAALPIACVQTPPPSPQWKSEKGPFSDFYRGERGLYTGYFSHPFTYFLISGQLLRTPDISNFFPGRLD